MVNELHIRQLSKTYRAGAIHALRDVELMVPPGIFGLLGPNGAGKSTLMKIIATLQRPDTGSMRLGAVDGLQDPLAMRARLGYLPQDFGVYPGLSATALMDYFARLKGIIDPALRRHQIDALLEKVNLEAVKHRAVDTYSGGMRQRFGVAQALLGRPELMIVDEPTAGLDPVERNRLHRVLVDIGRHTAIIMSTHIVEDVANLCQRMAILQGGEIRLEGDPEQLVEGLAGQLWQAALSADEARAWQGGKVVSTCLRRGGLMLVVQASERPDERFVPKRPDLEDLYFLTVPQAGA